MMDIKSPVAEARNEYTYSASGQKLKVVQKWNPNFSTAPVIGSGINTASLTQARTTDYTGNIIYENNALKRILVDGGYYEGGVYYYYLADHLGNNHVVVKSDGTSIQSNSYYPFGMHYAPGIGYEKQPYKYNNKELDQMHGLNLYDYNARYYESALGRFTSVDPLAEKYYSWSPYVYVMDSPLKYTDPTGMYSTEEFKKDHGLTEDDFETYEEPIVLFGPQDPVKYTNSAKNIEYNKNDNIFYVFSHGSSYSVEYRDENGKAQRVVTPKDLNNLLSERSPKWKESMEKGESMTLIFFSCNVGNEDLNSNPIAKKMSEEYSNLKIYAPNGYAKTMGIIEGYEVGIQQESGGKNDNKNGGFNIYKGGKNVGFEKFTYPDFSVFRKAVFKF